MDPTSLPELSKPFRVQKFEEKPQKKIIQISKNKKNEKMTSNPVNGFKQKNRLKNTFAYILTCTEAVRPEKLTIWVKFYVESEFRVENA